MMISSHFQNSKWMARFWQEVIGQRLRNLDVLKSVLPYYFQPKFTINYKITKWLKICQGVKYDLLFHMIWNKLGKAWVPYFKALIDCAVWGVLVLRGESDRKYQNNKKCYSTILARQRLWKNFRIFPFRGDCSSSSDWSIWGRGVGGCFLRLGIVDGATEQELRVLFRDFSFTVWMYEWFTRIF